LAARRSISRISARPTPAAAESPDRPEPWETSRGVVLAGHRIEVELRRSGDLAAKGGDQDKLGAGRVRPRDPIQPIRARLL